ncbi:CHASE2 domain-containing protein [Rhizobium sp. SSA_523]|uniref:CHASE2 domain-containing protein n=1 Tax=Rhizobium sp. SSA_523 TaxID=2952477 RepID=UPI0025AF9467|nr:adenylate/guanylate cyclase domain-containing protein [Rhizobium sp. SSA_523]WKC22027.1 adenylate/guanylate cyclase domain-containing protein [Rhizobium sp. SSA_523]
MRIAAAAFSVSPILAASRTRQVLVLALTVLVLTIVMQRLPAWALIDYRSFDYLSTFRPPALPDKGPVIVAIDEPSLAEINRQWPWPRSLHGDLVKALRAAGARVIALDIIFSEPSTASEDAALAAAVRQDVVLAGDESVISSPQAEQHLRTLPLALFTDSGASAGIASVSLHEDGVLRAIPGGKDSFAASIMRAASLPPPPRSQGLLLQTYGGPRTYPTVSYYQALRPDEFLPEGFFRDRLVIVGLSLQNAPTVSSGGFDSFATPATIQNGLLTAGAEVQATILDNLRAGHGIAKASAGVGLLVLFFAAALSVLLVWRGTTWFTWSGAILVVILGVIGSYALLRLAGLFISPAAPSALVAATVLLQGGFDYATERRSRRQITEAFSKYLSHSLVEKLASNPDQLKLGGEKRELTILFCDVRGFSTIAEGMKNDPEQLTRLVNRLLTPLSNVILTHGGTIDKYIGDCIMAFWNAPLPNPDHARHAVAAARDMLQALAALNAELRAEAERMDRAHVDLKIGIGINTGECVVGNMGSDRRFDYSALGDAVNLASRLEGASKTYGVPILLGETTALQVSDAFALRELESTTVKGRSEVSRVFTLLEE